MLFFACRSLGVKPTGTALRFNRLDPTAKIGWTRARPSESLHARVCMANWEAPACYRCLRVRAPCGSLQRSTEGGAFEVPVRSPVRRFVVLFEVCVWIFVVQPHFGSAMVACQCLNCICNTPHKRCGFLGVLNFFPPRIDLAGTAIHMPVVPPHCLPPMSEDDAMIQNNALSRACNCCRSYILVALPETFKT